MSSCETCGEPVPEGKRYCSRECYYFRKQNTVRKPLGHVQPKMPITITGEVIGKVEQVAIDIEPHELPKGQDPFEEQLAEEGIIVTGVSDEFCEVCGAPKYLGRCSRFTTHKPPKKPKSR